MFDIVLPCKECRKRRRLASSSWTIEMHQLCWPPQQIAFQLDLNSYTVSYRRHKCVSASSPKTLGSETETECIWTNFFAARRISINWPHLCGFVWSENQTPIQPDDELSRCNWHLRTKSIRNSFFWRQKTFTLFAQRTDNSFRPDRVYSKLAFKRDN